MEAEQRLHVKEFVIQKMSRGLSVSQICHRELIFSLFLILPLVQCETAKGLWCIHQGDVALDFPARCTPILL